MSFNDILIGIVGPCKSGKSTLSQGLIKHGWNAKMIAQEHSYTPTMWQKLTNPDLLIYLDVDYDNSIKRSDLNWKQSDLDEQKRRLQHAHAGADLYIDTSGLSRDQVLSTVIEFLDKSSPKN